MYNQFPYSNFNSSPFGTMPTLSNSSGLGGLLGLSKNKFNWDSFLNNTQRTLNVINQAMPIYNQVRPIFKNMGTIFRVIGELNSAGAGATAAASTGAATTTASAAAVTAASSVPQFFA